MATKKIVEKKKVMPPMKQVSKKTAYDVKEASNPKLTASARKNYADNAEAAMKQMKPKGPMQKKSPVYQTMGAVGMGAGTAEGKYATKKIKEAGKAYVKFSKDLDAQSNRRGATQLKSVAKKQVAAKKAPGKMKKC
jgi:hypothetical protein